MGFFKPSSQVTTTEGKSPTIGAKTEAVVKENSRDGITFWSESTSDNKAPEAKK